MTILQLSHINRDQATQLIQLQDTIQKRWQNGPVIYWHIIKKARPIPCNLLAYAGQELIAFCSRYLFQLDSCELSLMIHPRYENEFLIRQLVMQINSFIPPEHKKFISITTPHDCKPQYKPEAAWEYLYSSYRLQWQGPVKKPIPPQEFTLAKAKPQDFSGFKNLTNIGFPHGTEMIPEIFNHIIEDQGTQLWLLKKEQEVIGSIQVNQENKIYRISDITVLPEYRQQGLGNFLLKSIVYQLHQRQKLMVLDVESNNSLALNWYLGLGMKKINCADFWRLPYQDFIQ
jgi:predicted acetyltransferase